MTRSRSDFPPGTRVCFHPSEHGFEAASLGISGLVVHLNANPMLTATVLGKLPHYYHDLVDIRPDGWPLPEGIAPEGFCAHLGALELWPEDGPIYHCILTDEISRQVSKAEIERLITERIRKAKEA